MGETTAEWQTVWAVDELTVNTVAGSRGAEAAVQSATIEGGKVVYRYAIIDAMTGKPMHVGESVGTRRRAIDQAKGAVDLLESFIFFKG